MSTVLLVLSYLAAAAVGWPIWKLLDGMQRRVGRWFEAWRRQHRPLPAEASKIVWIGDHPLLQYAWRAAGLTVKSVWFEETKLAPNLEQAALLLNTTPGGLERDRDALRAKQAATDTRGMHGDEIGLALQKVRQRGALVVPEFFLYFARADRAAKQIVGSAWRRGTSAVVDDARTTGRDLRELLSETVHVDVNEVVPALSGSFGIDLTVESCDGWMAVSHRSPETEGPWGDCFHVPVNEGMEDERDLESVSRKPSVDQLIVRGLNEELLGYPHLEVARSKIDKTTLHTLFLDLTGYEWACTAHLVLRLSKDEIQEQWKIYARNSWEHRLDWIHWNSWQRAIKDLEELTKKDLIARRPARWVPYGAFALYRAACLTWQDDDRAIEAFRVHLGIR